MESALYIRVFKLVALYSPFSLLPSPPLPHSQEKLFFPGIFGKGRQAALEQIEFKLIFLCEHSQLFQSRQTQTERDNLTKIEWSGGTGGCDLSESRQRWHFAKKSHPSFPGDVGNFETAKLSQTWNRCPWMLACIHYIVKGWRGGYAKGIDSAPISS